MKIIVTIPAFNEEETIGDVISDIQKTFDQTDYQYEIQVLNDGSTDKTIEVAKSHNVKVYSHAINLGLAETFRDEIKYALENGADIIVHTDADGQYRSSDIINLIKPIVDGESDFVLGSRFMGTIEEMPVIKKLGNIAFSRVVSRITGIHISDAQTGFRAFRKEVAQNVNVFSNFTYTQEQIIKVAGKQFRIKEVPIFFDRRSAGTSRLMKNPVDYAIRAGINLFRIYRDFAPLKFFGIFGVLLIILSTIIFGWSFLFSLRIPDITIILLFLSGMQIILFGFLAEMIDNGFQNK